MFVYEYSQILLLISDSISNDTDSRVLNDNFENSMCNYKLTSSLSVMSR